MIAVVPLSIVTLPVVPAVVAEMAPVNTLVSPRVISLSVPLEVKLDVPVTVRFPVCVISPPVLIARSPFTVWALTSKAPVFDVVSVRLPSVVNVARLIAVEPLFKVISAPFDPPDCVVNVSAPVIALELFKLISISSVSYTHLTLPTKA